MVQRRLDIEGWETDIQCYLKIGFKHELFQQEIKLINLSFKKNVNGSFKVFKINVVNINHH
jgi:hypothetical protein